MPKTAVDISQHLRQRLQSGYWPAGFVIPGEEQLARDYGVSRMTMNRAVMMLVDAGLLVRKRKAGTRVADPVSLPARLDIPLDRPWIEDQGLIYDYRLLDRREVMVEDDLARQLGLEDFSRALYLRCLHLGNNRVLIAEDRWFNADQLPDCLEESFHRLGPAAWLAQRFPFCDCLQAVQVAMADQVLARHMSQMTGAALMVAEKRESVQGQAISFSRRYFPANRITLAENGFAP